ncbi:MAG: hypothetical protein COC24_013310 [Alphaproteobacteria bacterium]|nr:hypothetical protein [Alphaproteobacteria bacterium]
MSETLIEKDNSEVEIFSFKDTHRIRTVTIEGEPWFVAVDVLRCLDMPFEKGTYKYLQYLDETEQELATRKSTPEIFVGASGGGVGTKIISESGLYKLLLRSTKPEAKPFQDWITKEVIPTIRKTGQYDLKMDSGRDTLPMPQNFAEALRGHAEALMRQAELEEEVHAKKAALATSEKAKEEAESLQRKAEAARVDAENQAMRLQTSSDCFEALFVTKKEGLVDIIEIARKISGINTHMLKKSLAQLGFLYKQGGAYRVYSKYREVLFVEKFGTYMLQNGKIITTNKIMATRKGAEKLAALGISEKLIMRKGISNANH